MSAQVKQLVDGQAVAGDSREWAHECLARHVQRKLPRDRRLWLQQYEAKHGAADTQALLATMHAVQRAAR